MKRLRALLLVALLLAPTAFGQGVYIGQNDAGNGHAVRPPGSLRASLFENTAGAGSITEIGIYLFAPATGRIRLGFYYHQDSNTNPGYLRLDAGEVVNPVVGWNSVAVAPGVLHLFAGERIWLAWVNDVSVDVYQNTAFSFSYVSMPYAALPNAFGVSGIQFNRTSIRAKVVSDAAPARVPLSPGFASRPSVARVGRPIQFTDFSKGDIVSWLWDFGDGTTSTERSPVHAFSEVGTFEVSLTISDGVTIATARLGGN
jgi:hypothetical protein